MRHGNGIIPFLLVLVLFLPPLLNVCFKLYQLTPSKSPAGYSFGSGKPDNELDIPTNNKRGDFIPARVIDFSSTSTFRSTFFITFSSKQKVSCGTVVIAPPWTLAGLVVKVWPWTEVALVKCVDDPKFRISCISEGKEIILQGNGKGLGLEVIRGSFSSASSEEFRTSGKNLVFPGKLLIGYSKEGEKNIIPVFSLHNNTWVYCWSDPDLERVKEQVELRFPK